MSNKILLIGSNGQVGRELVATLMPLGTLTAVSRKECDLTNKQALSDLINTLKPNIIVNAAAYTQVDEAQSDIETCFAVNAEAPKVLAELSLKNNALLVHYSTDYVFDGESTQAWLETDDLNPKNIYGMSKLIGEKFIIDSNCQYLILRTSWVYGLHGTNFLLTMLHLMKERETLNVVNDQIGSPTWSRSIAECTSYLVHDYLKNPKKQVKELLHFSAKGETNWCEFAREIATLAGNITDLKLNDPEKILGIPSSEYPQKAFRPKYSVMNTNKLTELYGIEMPNWKDQLKCCLTFMK